MSKTLLWKIAVVFGIFTFLGLLFAGQLYLFVNSVIPQQQEKMDHHPSEFGPISFLWAFALNLSDWYVWAAFTPLIVWISQRYPIRPERMISDLAIHIFFSLIFLLIKTCIEALISMVLVWPPDIHGTILERVQLMLSVRFHNNLLIYWVIFGVIYAVNFYQIYREKELKTSQLEAQLAQAQLQVLKMQLHPHFLFNTLNTISTLVYKDPDAADRMISRLSDLLRYTLQNIGIQEVSLKEELDFLKRYLEIEQIRFQDRLRIDYEVDPKSLDAQVPNMILQPLVENSIRHGIAKRSQAGRIQIRTRQEKARLILQIQDNGPGIRDESNDKNLTGIGLSNTKLRLQQLYGASHHFVMNSTTDGGTEVSLDIPYHPTPQRSTSYGKEKPFEDTSSNSR